MRFLNLTNSGSERGGGGQFLLAWACALLLLSQVGGFGETLHVHAIAGDDTQSGSLESPLKTVKQALSRAKAGDTILLIPGQPPIHESILINNQSGEPGKPITIDGGGNLLCGARAIDENDWKEISPGLYRCERIPALKASMKYRYFLLMDGTMNRMGRSSKGVHKELPNVADLQPEEWTYVEAESAFYIATQKGKSLSASKVQSPIFMNGLGTRGECRHWIVRNINVQHFINDGFNFHGVTEDFVIENASAFECGDDGMSAHGDCDVVVRGFTSRRNSTGICHVERSSSKNFNVHLDGNFGANLYLLGSGTHDFTDSVISAHEPGIRIGGKTDRVRVTMMDCELPWPEASASSPENQPVTVAAGSELKLLGRSKLGQ